ncbi:hypothetical protein [Arthrobacter flavus]|uniref:Antitoxin Xre/MbcA/ParS-like toxin-binding domain-containing protein n=1 Tax=Arthrobacter flavus TaxID=95172 RepID=A0ABW4Q7Q0_9MICC
MIERVTRRDRGDYKFITSSGSVYRLVLKDDSKTLTRFTQIESATEDYEDESVSDLRRDGDPIPVLNFSDLEVGKNGNFWLQIRDDGVETFRCTTPITTIEIWRARTTVIGIREIVRRLNVGLGATLVAGLAGSTVRDISREWQKVNGAEPGPEAQQRLRLAHQVWRIISDAEGEHIARLWFIGSNLWLNDDSPIDAIREDRADEVIQAAEAVVTGQFSG